MRVKTLDVLTFSFYTEYLVVRYASGNFKISTFIPWSFPDYGVARNFCDSLFLRIGDFFCFAEVNFCD